MAFRALFIHGVGRQDASFADVALHALADGLERRGHRLLASSVHWAGFADRVQDRFIERAEKHGSAINPSQKLVVGTLADALMYATNPTLQGKIFRLLDQHVKLVRAPFTIFAHSLGGLIATDWLRQRTALDVRLVTLGCNIGLFNLGKRFASVPSLDGPGRWINLFSSRDMLGFPLAHEEGLEHVQDVKVSVGGWFRGWTGLAHTLYWTDESLWRKTVPGLLKLG